MCNQVLTLVHHIVVNSLAFVLFHVGWLSVVNAEQVVAEGWNHEELLHHAIHVANAAQITQSNVLLISLSGDLWWHIAPKLGLLNCLDKWGQLLVQECLHQSCTVLD